MKRIQCRIARVYALLVLLISGPRLTQASFLPDAMQMHGFLAQFFFNSSYKNLYGQSDDGISPGLSEIGLKLSYLVLDNAALYYNILLAQSVYFDRSRSQFVSSGGGALYIDHLTDSGDFSFKMNIGLPQNESYLDKDDKIGARNAQGG